MNVAEKNMERKKLFREYMKVNGEPIVTEEVFKRLEDNGFFVKPAAIKYHGNYTGGLFDHSFAVAKTLEDMTVRFGLRWQHERSAKLVGMLHDVCKLDDYMENPNWPGEWTYNPSPRTKGHGSKSVLMLGEIMQLGLEEIHCIRYHMGAYETEAWRDYDVAIREYPNVLFTHTADMYASKILNV